jgi:hypothetical protein
MLIFLVNVENKVVNSVPSPLCIEIKGMSTATWAEFGQALRAGALMKLKKLGLKGKPLADNIYLNDFADSNPTPQFCGLLLEAMFHYTLPLNSGLSGFHGPFERSDDAFFHILPLEITESKDALLVRAVDWVLVYFISTSFMLRGDFRYLIILISC